MRDDDAPAVRPTFLAAADMLLEARSCGEEVVRGGRRC